MGIATSTCPFTRLLFMQFWKGDWRAEPSSSGRNLTMSGHFPIFLGRREDTTTLQTKPVSSHHAQTNITSTYRENTTHKLAI